MMIKKNFILIISLVCFSVLGNWVYAGGVITMNPADNEEIAQNFKIKNIDSGNGIDVTGQGFRVIISNGSVTVITGDDSVTIGTAGIEVSGDIDIKRLNQVFTDQPSVAQPAGAVTNQNRNDTNNRLGGFAIPAFLLRSH